jgi:hypothetical protein
VDRRHPLYGRLHFVPDPADVGAKPLENGNDYTFVLLEQGGQQVFGSDLLLAPLGGEILCCLYGLLGLQCETVMAATLPPDCLSAGFFKGAVPLCRPPHTSSDLMHEAKFGCENAPLAPTARAAARPAQSLPDGSPSRLTAHMRRATILLEA